MNNEHDPRHFIRGDGQLLPPGPPVQILHVEISVPSAGQLFVHFFQGPDAEEAANAHLLSLANGREANARPLIVEVATRTADGFSYHAVHQVKSCNPDYTIRGHIVRVLQLFVQYGAYQRHYDWSPERLRALLASVAGVPNQVSRSEALSYYAIEEQGNHTLRQRSECGMEEFYSHLVHLLRLGFPPEQALHKARLQAEADFLPDRSAPFAFPDPEATEYLAGIEAAFTHTQRYLSNLEAEA